MESALYALLGTAVGGLISFVLQKQRLNHELKLKREEYKTEFMAENTARHFLNHKSFTDRASETLQKNLGGFGDDELRKMLVRAGAIRVIREDGTEWWRLLSRMEEYIERKKEEE